MKRITVLACFVLALCMIVVSFSAAAEQKTAGAKAKSFWQKLFNYPANVTKESADVVADTGKRSAGVVTKEVKRVGEVTSGDVAKTKELVTEPITGTAETAVKAVEETAVIPTEAAKEAPASEPAPAEKM